jgi:anti-sigma factor RsiW
MNQRDLELLSSYLDGQLNPSDSARLETRIHADPNLRSVLEDLRSARSLLRQLPMRKAPRNFKLTPKMVGKNPPLPRAYPAFRFATTLATLLLFFTFGLNFLRPQLASAPQAFGKGGGAGEVETFAAEAAPATEAPAAEEPSILMVPMPTATIAAQEDTARAAVTKNGETENGVGDAAQEPPQIPSEASEEVPFVSSVWQWLLAGVALLSAFIMALMRQLSINRWRRK